MTLMASCNWAMLINKENKDIITTKNTKAIQIILITSIWLPHSHQVGGSSARHIVLCVLYPWCQGDCRVSNIKKLEPSHYALYCEAVITSIHLKIATISFLVVISYIYMFPRLLLNEKFLPLMLDVSTNIVTGSVCKSETELADMRVWTLAAVYYYYYFYY